MSSAGWRLSLPFLPPHHGEVEIDPEQDVDNEESDEGFQNILKITNHQLPHDVTPKQDASG